MNLKFTARQLGKLVQESSPTILTGLGVAGVVATGYFAAKGSFKAAEAIEEAKPFDFNTPNEPRPESLTVKEKSLLVWKLYIPAVSTGALSIVCIVAANRIQARRMAALAAAYAVLSGDFDEYKQKALELVGAKKHTELNDNVAKDKMAKHPIPSEMVLPDGKTWFCDMSTMRYFPSTMETVKYGQNQINYNINNDDAQSLNDFYEAIGLDATTVGEKLGWNKQNNLELTFTAQLHEAKGAVTAFRFTKEPKPDFWKG